MSLVGLFYTVDFFKYIKLKRGVLSRFDKMNSRGHYILLHFLKRRTKTEKLWTPQNVQLSKCWSQRAGSQVGSCVDKKKSKVLIILPEKGTQLTHFQVNISVCAYGYTTVMYLSLCISMPILYIICNSRNFDGKFDTTPMSVH